jgi:pyruvate-formate lyase-activating enzyme
MYFCSQHFLRNITDTIPMTGDFKKDIETFLKHRDRLITEIRDGIPNACSGCIELEEGLYYKTKKIRNVSFGFPGVCNIKCSYCCADDMLYNISDKEVLEKTKTQLVFLKYLIEHGYIDKDCVCEVGSGEIAIHPMRDEVLELIEEQSCAFFTNATVYNEKIAEILRKCKSQICISFDAGSNRTYKHIKKYDFFDKVKENTIRYSECSVVEVKYIILRGINDKKAEIDGFMDFLKKTNKENIIVSLARDFSDTQMVDMDFCDEFKESVLGLGIMINMPDSYFGRGL